MSDDKSGKQTTSRPLKEGVEKAGYKGPSDSKPIQPQQEIDPRPTNQQGGDEGGGQQSESGTSSDE